MNWCPGLGTVLSNEEVTAEGRSEIGNFPVFRRNLRQWMMRITSYADRLLDDLDRLDWPESVKSMQRNWIGRSYGARVELPGAAPPRAIGDDDRGVHHPSGHPVRRDLHGAGAGAPAGRADHRGALAGGHRPALDRRRGHPGAGRRPTTGWRRRASPIWTVRRTRRRPASSPARSRSTRSTDAELPVFIADYVLMGYGTGAIMAVPGQDTRDWDFATVFGIADHPDRAAVGGSSDGRGVHR